MVTAGSILAGTFQFARANIRTILIWSLTSLVIGLVMRMALAPLYEAQAAAAASLASGVAAPPPQLGPGFLLILPAMVFVLVLYNAVFRAALFPEQSGFAYLRLGMDELRLLGLLAILWVASFGVVILLGVVIAIVGVAVFATSAAGGGGAAAGLGALTVILLSVAIWVGGGFLAVRLSLAAPLTLYRRKIMIGPAWRLTRGRFWTLFGAYLVVVFGVMIVSAVLVAPQIGAMMADIARPGDPDAARRLAELQARQMRLDLSVGGILWMLLSSLVGGALLAFGGGVPAVATAQLLNEAEAPAAVFE